ncbi:MAG: citrate lyase holo-[acyl-carrier protein] synthase [Spirochaetia bacterium]|jgi:holo-ACP synthase/triphosphoribosyl-dephospho-CoA synthase|nr:citrate lyase holo-[acyl-carrier protein] synthase [Spirochaetia bacterium]
MREGISVDDIGKAREERAEKIKKILSVNDNITAILFTLNIPGKIKDTPLYRKMHRAGTSEITRSLKWRKIRFTLIDTAHLVTGSEAYLAVSTISRYGSKEGSGADSAAIKMITAEIEETHPLGRFFDIDVFEKPHNKISSGRGLRKCFLCGRDAFICARSAAHPVEELLETIREKGEAWLREYYSWKIAEIACKSLLTEAASTPKPGLVDMNNSGSHTDMDFFTFLESSASLYKTFFKIAQTGYDYSSKPLPEMLPPLKTIGIAAEKDMYKATDGVNTHKGLIFSLGLLAAAAGYICAKHEIKLTAETVCSSAGVIIAEDTAAYLAKLKEKGEDLNILPELNPTTGERLFIEHGIKGARGEAAGGFKSALKGYSHLRANLSKGRDFNLSLVDTLMRIMEDTQDTNIPGRKDLASLVLINRKAENFNREGGIFRGDRPGAAGKTNAADAHGAVDAVKALDKLFIEKNLSPGGCADILAMSIFLYFLERDTDPVISSDYGGGSAFNIV